MVTTGHGDSPKPAHTVPRQNFSFQSARSRPQRARPGGHGRPGRVEPHPGGRGLPPPTGRVDGVPRSALGGVEHVRQGDAEQHAQHHLDAQGDEDNLPLQCHVLGLLQGGRDTEGRTQNWNKKLKNCIKNGRWPCSNLRTRLRPPQMFLRGGLFS